MGSPQITVWMVAVVGRGEGLGEGRGIGRKPRASCWRGTRSWSWVPSWMFLYKKYTTKLEKEMVCTINISGQFKFQTEF